MPSLPANHGSSAPGRTPSATAGRCATGIAPESKSGTVVEIRQSAGRLTPRELSVANYATLGNKEIAIVLGISECTVRAHLSNIARKTGLEGRAAIAVMADRVLRRAA